MSLSCLAELDMQLLSPHLEQTKHRAPLVPGFRRGVVDDLRLMVAGADSADS